MILRERNPASMTATERRTEIAEILAMGYLRLQVTRQSNKKCLDACTQSEAPCDSKAKNPENPDEAA